MWFVIIVTAILFIAAFPKFSLAVGIVIGIGYLFKRWASRFYFNFVIALLAKVILEEVGKKVFIFKAIDGFIKYIAKATLLTKYFGNDIIDYDYFVVIAVVLTLTDMLVRKLYCAIMTKIYSKKTDSTLKQNKKVNKNIVQKEIKEKVNKVNKEVKDKKVNKEIKDKEDLFNDLVFSSQSIDKNS